MGIGLDYSKNAGKFVLSKIKLLYSNLNDKNLIYYEFNYKNI